MRNTAAMPYPALLEEIRAALDLVVFLARDERGRRGVFGIDAIRADGVSPVFVRETDGIRLVAQA